MKRTLIILGSIVALLIILIFVFFEIKDVPDIDIGNSYNVEAKDTGGLFVFYKMLKKLYGENNSDFIISDNFDFLENRENTLLVSANKNILLDSISLLDIEAFLENGNEVLFISKYLNFKDNPWSNLLETSSYHDTLFHLEWNDTLAYTYKPLVLNDFDLIGNYDWLSYFESSKEITNTQSSLDQIATHEDILHLQDSLCIFRKVSTGSSAMYFHTVPELFMNSAAVGEFYLMNFNKTFDNFKNEKVVFHKFKKNNIRDGARKESYIQYILSEPSLKFAYYLTILMALIYVFFSSKRKQKEIPIIKKSKNTSLEYINTMSAIFMAQDQNEKLVKHMEKNFFHKMKTLYFIDRDDTNFAQKLSKKSKVPIALINKILKQFSGVGSYDFNDDQLIRLHNDVNSFYQNRK